MLYPLMLAGMIAEAERANKRASALRELYLSAAQESDPPTRLGLVARAKRSIGSAFSRAGTVVQGSPARSA